MKNEEMGTMEWGVENARATGWDFRECEGGYRYVTGEVEAVVTKRSISIGLVESGVTLFYEELKAGTVPAKALCHAGRAADTLANAFKEVRDRLNLC